LCGRSQALPGAAGSTVDCVELRAYSLLLGTQRDARRDMRRYGVVLFLQFGWALSLTAPVML
jgi:hypothetical protein